MAPVVPTNELWKSRGRVVGGCIVAASLTLVGCSRAPVHDPPRSSLDGVTEVRVAAASDLQFALGPIIDQFGQANAGSKISATYGSSGNLYAQIENGAPFDVFLSADVKLPERLIGSGKAVPNSLFRYAIGRIVLWAPKTSPIDLEKEGMKALLHPTVRKIAIANPAHAPYGAAAEAAMKTAGLYGQTSSLLVLGENVTQAAHFIESGAADIGIIALSVALSPQLKEAGRFWLIPSENHPPLEQGGIITTVCKNPLAAAEFTEALTGREGRETLRRYGFTLPEP